MGDELLWASDIAIKGADLALSFYSPDKMETRAKGQRDIVTAADVAVERFVRESLRKRFPADDVVGEEGGGDDSGGCRRWYVDPVDGTFNYSRGIPVWCLSLALFEARQPVLGAIRDPLRGEIFVAARGRGAKCNGATLAATSQLDLSRAVVHMTVDFDDESMNVGLDDLRRLQPKVLRTRNLGSVALALAYVAAGRLDAVLHRFAHTWDFGAGVALILETGGCVTAIDGSPYREGSTSVLAAGNGELHAALLHALRSH
ncbi:MAG: inositol monophosphatase family protein [Chloroflexota bacterium]|nr:MAG: inositol monophosphatase [Chloroflexota bacterium]